MGDKAQPALTGKTMALELGFDAELAQSVVVVYDVSLVPSRSRSGPHRRRRHPFRRAVRLGDDVDLIVASGPGAPVAAITVEFLAALGVRRLVSVGAAGLLHDDGEDDQRTRVVSETFSDEGTSAHYGSNVQPDADLTQRLSTEFEHGGSRVVTTDAPFRHTPARLAEHRARGDLIEMECAALFAACRQCGLAGAAVLVPSDVFGRDGWRRLDESVTRAQLERAIRLTAAALSEQA